MCYFCYDFPRFSPRVHHYPMKSLGTTMIVVVGSGRKGGIHQQRGGKGLLEGRQLRELMAVVVDTRDWGYQRRWSPWAIDD